MIDETIVNKVDFNKQDGLVPVIVQDYLSNEVLMLAYMNQEALQMSLNKKMGCYYSRSRNQLWLKGETSGHFQYIKEIKLDCDCDTILMKVKQVGAACHTGNHTCFYTTIMKEDATDEE